MARLYYVEFSHMMILQQVDIDMETEEDIVIALGCSLNKIPKKISDC